MKKVQIFGQEISLIWVVFLFLIITSGIGGCSYRVFWWTSVENYEIAFRWNKSDGKITRVKHTGWCRITPFFTKIRTIDSRPVQIKIEANSTKGGVNNRILNAKLVQFDPKGAAQLFEYHGFDHYNQSDLAEILKIYAYEDCATSSYNADSLQAKYHFLKILGETSGVGNNLNTPAKEIEYEKNN